MQARLGAVLLLAALVPMLAGCTEARPADVEVWVENRQAVEQTFHVVALDDSNDFAIVLNKTVPVPPSGQVLAGRLQGEAGRYSMQLEAARPGREITTLMGPPGIRLDGSVAELRFVITEDSVKKVVVKR